MMTIKFDSGLGISQKRTAVTRVSGTTYTNTSGKPIAVSVSLTNAATVSYFYTTISINGGVEEAIAGTPYHGGLSVKACGGEKIVQNNETYKLTDYYGSAGTRETQELS